MDETKQLSDFERVGIIGEGTFGIVWLATNKKEPYAKVALKEFKDLSRKKDGVPLTVLRELLLLRELDNEHVIHLQDVLVDDQRKAAESRALRFVLVFDYVEYDLAELIRYHKEHDIAMPPTMIKSVTHQLLQGLTYLHRNYVIHRDLKPSNVLIVGSGDGLGCVKIADFGLARVFLEPVSTLATNAPVVVTLWYRAPELLLGAEDYTPAVDIWAAGCIFIEMLRRQPFFNGTEQKEPFQNNQMLAIMKIMGPIILQEWPEAERLPFYKQVSAWSVRNVKERAVKEFVDVRSSAYQLLWHLLCYNPTGRLTAEDATSHRYFNEFPPPAENVFLGENDVQFPIQYPVRTLQKPRKENLPTRETGGTKRGADGEESTAKKQRVR